MNLIYVVPSRGRPQNARRLLDAFERHATLDTTQLIFGLDDDDDTLDDYVDVINVGVEHGMPVDFSIDARRGMSGTLNELAVRVAALPETYAIGFMGDDHVPQTMGWDQRYQEMLRAGHCVVYGNDLVQGETLPTQVALHADIVRALGFMAPRELKHLFIDNYWYDLGNALHGRCYVPDVIVQHIHPITGATAWDETYVHANANMLRDEMAYTAYKNAGFIERDAELVREYQMTRNA